VEWSYSGMAFSSLWHYIRIEVGCMDSTLQLSCVPLPRTLSSARF